MTIERLKEIVSRYPKITTAFLYGTAASGKLRPTSDIDVALLLAEPYSQKELVSLETHVICDIEAAFHREADVKTLNQMEHLPLLHEIFSKSIRLCDRDPVLRRAFMVKKNLEYFDFLPHYHRILNAYAKRIRKHGSAKSGISENHSNSTGPGENTNALVSHTERVSE